MPAPRLLTLALVPALALGALSLTGCGEREVKQVDPNSTTELSGNWSVQNSKKVAAQMISSAMEKPWSTNFIEKSKRNPKVQLHRVIVRADTGETINPDPFMKAIRQEFVNSGKIDVLDEDIKSTREVITDQNQYGEKGKEMAKEDSADFVLKGSISTIVDQDGRRSSRYYSVTLELTDVQSRRVVWTDTTEIGKEIEQSRWK